MSPPTTIVIVDYDREDYVHELKNEIGLLGREIYDAVNVQNSKIRS